jgi:hypothetical protein
MAIKAADIPNILVERIEAAHPAPGYFSAGETDDWPTGVREQLLTVGVLQGANRAEAVVCPGCENQCQKAVVVRISARQERRAFINCDEEPAHGRVPINLRSLEQYRIMLNSMASMLSALLGFGTPRASKTGAQYLLGELKGRKGLRTVSIGITGGQLLLSVGAQQQPLVQVLRANATVLSIDRRQIQRLADRKGSQPNQSKIRGSYQRDRSSQRERSRQTLKRNRAIFLEAKRLHRAGAGDWSAISQIISKTKLAENEKGRRISANTVRRTISTMMSVERKNSRSKPASRR